MARRSARDGTLKGLRDVALIAVASDLWARVSEVTGLRVRDVEHSPDGTATVEVWQGKTGRSRTGYLRASTVRRLDAWTATAEIDAGDAPLFPSMDPWGNVWTGQAMQPRAAAAVIRQRAAAIGLRATGHSLRIGSAVSASAKGATLPQILSQPSQYCDKACAVYFVSHFLRFFDKIFVHSHTEVIVSGIPFCRLQKAGSKQCRHY